MSEPSIAARVLALQRLSLDELRAKWKELTGQETTQRHKGYLLKRCAWELQRRHFGQELSPEARARLHELQAEFRDNPPEAWFKGARANRAPTSAPPKRSRAVRDPAAPKPGTILTREYRGTKVVVTVRGERDFEWRGEIYKSLSAVATAISGAHCSGPAFFGLTKKGGSR